MRKKILLVIASVVSIGALVGGATMALFTDSASSGSNDFTAGTLQMELRRPGENAAVAGPLITVTNMAPGDTETFEVDVHATGSLDMVYYLTLQRTNSNSPVANLRLSENLQFRAFRWDGTGWVEWGDTQGGTAAARPRTMQEWHAKAVPDYQGVVAAGQYERLKFEAHLPLSTPNTAQGGTVQFKFVAEATQIGRLGLLGEYFANHTLSGLPAMTRIDPTINYDWDTTRFVPGMPAERISVRWTGYLEVTEEADYYFQTRSDDGVRFWIDTDGAVDMNDPNAALINVWTVHGAANHSHPSAVHLTPGRYPIKMEWFDNYHHAVARLSWRQSTTSTFTVIPQTNLYQP